MVQPLDGQFAAIGLHFDIAIAQRVTCHAVTDDLYSMYHSEGEKKIGEMTGSGHSVQIANEDLHETKLRNTSKILINFREC
jgi:hypothetical protein